MTEKIDIEKLFSEYGIDFTVTENGWCQTYCPFCYRNDGKMGLGIHIESNAVNCFRCGKMSLKSVILKALGKNALEWPRIAERFRAYKKGRAREENAVEGRLNAKFSLSWPYGAGNLADRHKKYLKSRDFDPDRLATEWGLKGTGGVGPFKHRIIIPVYQAGKLVNFTARDITGKSKQRYRTCPNEQAVIPLKNCLYGIDKVEKDSVIITEGPTKVWRLGAGAVATFGVVVTTEQLFVLSKFKKRIILFDNDEAGCRGAEKLSRQLRVFDGSTDIIIVSNCPDIAELPEKKVAWLKGMLI